jgi:hypothetical protein
MTIDLKQLYLRSLRCTTDAQGKASFDVDLPKEESVYYTADVTTLDSKDRQ